MHPEKNINGNTNVRRERDRLFNDLSRCRTGWRQLKEIVFGTGTDADKLADIQQLLGRNLRNAVQTGGRWYDLIRHQDATGVSGTGRVAEVAEFEDGTAVLRWLSGTPSTVVYESLEHVTRIHGHGGSTEVRPRTQ